MSSMIRPIEQQIDHCYAIQQIQQETKEIKMTKIFWNTCYRELQYIFFAKQPRSISLSPQYTGPYRVKKLQRGPQGAHLQPPTRTRDAPPSSLRRTLPGLARNKVLQASSEQAGSRQSQPQRTRTTTETKSRAPPRKGHHLPRREARERKIRAPSKHTLASPHRRWRRRR